MKNGLFKLCSMILVIVLLINMLPLQVMAEQLNTGRVEQHQDQLQQVLPQEDVSADRIVGEISQKRTEFSKEFLLENGLHMATVYPEAVHYETAEGWQEIDNRLITRADGTITNTAGIWDVSFPQQLSKDKGITVKKDGYTLSFFMAGELTVGSNSSVMAASLTTEAAAESLAVTNMQQTAALIRQPDLEELRASVKYEQAVPEKAYSRIAYENAYKNTDVIYDLESNRVKESIVLESYNSALRGYRYTLDVGSMLPVLETDGQITLYDAEGKNVVMIMPAPYMVDDAGELCEDVQVQLTGSGSRYTMTYFLPRQWLAAEDRAWPVILDPVVKPPLTTINIRDRSVTENWNPSQTWGYNACGYFTPEGIVRSYLKFEELPKLTSSDVIINATVQMYKHTGTDHAIPVNVHKVRTTWDSETLTWANKPSYDFAIEDYAIVQANQWYTWDVTDIARGWYSGENTGMMFKADSDWEVGPEQRFHYFLSSDYGSSKPILTIIFRNNNGLESYWDYTSATAGRAGTGHVNNYTGNLVWVRDDIGFGGNRMPVSISHIYNANDAYTINDNNNSNDTAGNSFGMGNGWRTNYNQLVYAWVTDSAQTNGTYYVWEDADGTDHYFTQDSDGIYKDEDGLALTLTFDGSQKTITDKYGNTSVFDAQGRLVRLQNNQETPSCVEIAYVGTTRQIDTITDGVGRKYHFNYSSGLLTKISYKGSNDEEITYVNFGYSGNNLESVTDKDGETCEYTYGANNLLVSATDVDGYTLTYTYNITAEAIAEGKPARVSRVEETHNNQDGRLLEFYYRHNETTVYDYSDDDYWDDNEQVYTRQVLQFNNMGNTVCIQDDQGRAQYMQFDKNGTKEEEEEEEETGPKKSNQLNLSSQMQNTVGNGILNPSFENNSVWDTAGTGSSVSIVNTEAYLGNNSLQVVTTTSGSGADERFYYVDPGKTVTLSAYVKTGSASAYISIYDWSAQWRSEILSPNSDWTRLQVSYTNTTQQTKRICPHVLTPTVGTLWVDCVQLEVSSTASRFNLLKDGDFQNSGYGWVFSDAYVRGAADGPPQLDETAMLFLGEPSEQRRLSQTTSLSGTANDCFVFSGWAIGDSAPLWKVNSQGNTPAFRLQLNFHYTDGSTSENFTVNFNPACDKWQYAAGAAVAKKNYSAVTMMVLYDYNINEVYFDGLQLYREEFGTSYKYDANGNVIEAVDPQKQKTEYSYSNNNLTSVIRDGRTEMTYTYDNYHNVKTATTALGQVYTFVYDEYGNNTAASVSAGGLTTTTSAVYTPDGNYLAGTEDAQGETTTYGHNEQTGVLEYVMYPESTPTHYTYDSMYRPASVLWSTGTGVDLSAEYTYSDDLLTELQTATTTYGFSYGNFTLPTSVRVGNDTLATYSYTTDRKHLLSALDYGNGDGVEYTYDKEGRVIQETYEDNDTVTYTYDNSGRLARTIDSASGITTTYYYDLIGRLVQTTKTGGDNYDDVTFIYDAQGNVNDMYHYIMGVKSHIVYRYDEDNRPIVSGDGRSRMEIGYDALGRLSEKETQHSGVPIITDTYNYYSPSANKTTMQVSSVQTAAGNYDTTYSYTYDANGNITSISNGTHTTSYVYDAVNQLVRENNQAGGFTHIWTYDDGGNILSRKEYAYTTEELIEAEPTDVVTYTYGDTDWGDLLTAYDGQTITHDEIGNPLSDGTWTYTWEHGRELAAMSNGNTTWTYTYDADGLRTKRTNGTNTYTYSYIGDKLWQYTIGDEAYYITYDALGMPWALYNDGTIYYYITNLQGDVIAILSDEGDTLVTYTYDAWGKLLSITGPMASTLGVQNLLRYRGYVYDSETNLYYLNSRYYNPEIGRFLNADNQIAGVGGEPLGYNMFAYCMNNPVNLSDPSGNWPRWATIALGAVVAVAAVAVTVVTLGAAAPAAVCTLTSVAMSVGASYGVASTVATVAVAATTVAAAAYAGDIAYSAVTGDSLLLDTVFQGNTDAYNTGLAITSIATAGMLEMAAQSPGVCFVAGTPVLVACGHIAIEEIKAGDMVWAENPETGEKELKEVVQTFVNETTELIYVQVDSEEIVTTPEHPFYSPIKGWIAACKLRAGDILVLQNGKYVTVEKVQHEILEAPITVYNFEVADFHTYYVGKSAVLVHNTCGGNSSSRGVGGKGWVGDKTWRENVSIVGKGGTITSLNGGVPSKAQAMQLINQSGGTALRIEGAHQFPNPHNYSHINYVTSTGVKGTIKIFE